MRAHPFGVLAFCLGSSQLFAAESGEEKGRSKGGNTKDLEAETMHLIVPQARNYKIRLQTLSPDVCGVPPKCQALSLTLRNTRVIRLPSKLVWGPVLSEEADTQTPRGFAIPYGTQRPEPLSSLRPQGKQGHQPSSPFFHSLGFFLLPNALVCAILSQLHLLIAFSSFKS